MSAVRGREIVVRAFVKKDDERFKEQLSAVGEEMTYAGWRWRLTGVGDSIDIDAGGWFIEQTWWCLEEG